MSVETELLVDRRALRRKLSVWRVLAFLFLAAALLTLYFGFVDNSALQHRGAHIARIRIDGFIGDQRANLDLFDDIAKSSAKAVIVTINSPGGATSGGEALYDGLRKLSASKPTVAVIGGLGASAAYMAAIGTDHIVARRTSLVGSIGVLVQYPNVYKLLDKIGVSVEAVKSSPLKAAPDGMTPTSPEATAALASIVNDTYAWFKSLVKDRRAYDDAGLAAVSDGRIFTGSQALNLRLIDEMGGEPAAIAWLARDKAVDKNLPVEDWTRRSSGSSFPFAQSGAAWVADMVGLTSLGDIIRAAPDPQSGALDGLVSVWHP